ncbi:MAG: ATP-binding protein [Ignavibacteria bacterium]|nr:ATP-binding protein [Ignavibacteria bacterium]
MSTKDRKLRMRFAGRFIDLLGNQMYGGPVPSVAELIANSWDADAKKVEVTIPKDITESGAEIIVKDYGEGMTFDELNDYYLHVGYERRAVRGETTDAGRLVMGRKGIGKLAGFGIAEDIIITSVKDGHLIEFELNYTELRKKKNLNGFEFTPTLDKATTKPNGVTVVFKNLKLTKNINIESFKKSMSRRFAIKTEVMEILINDKNLKKENLDLEYRIPPGKGEWTEENIPGFGTVQYWYGILNETIQDPELRGFSVFARERVAQFTPFFFNLTGGINGQVALEYLTGQLKADELDSTDDYIATDRQSINWQFGKAPILEAWGQDKIKKICSDWKKRHTQKNIDRFGHKLGEFNERIEKLSSTQEKKDLVAALEKVASIERITEEDFKIIANSMIAGIERESVKKVIQRINATSDDALPELYEAMKEWDIISAVSTAEVVYGKIKIIDQFKKHIDDRLPEKAGKGKLDMQTFIKENPWLLGHTYEQLSPADFSHEKGLDKWIEEILLETNKEYSIADKKDDKRFDLLCIKNDWLIVILELMRPGLPEDYDHISRLNRYVTRIQSYINDNMAAENFKGKAVFGLLIADNPSKDPSLGATKLSLRHNLESLTWKGLFQNVKENYKEYYDLLKNKAPEDPRLKGIINL